MQELISVIVPVYNSENYLPSCIESILNQSYKNIELLLIDDGSKDNSLSICHEFADKDDRVTVFHQENQGPSAAMNRGLNHAKGDFIAIVDCDDYLHPQMYEHLYENLITHKADFSVCSANDVYEGVQVSVERLTGDETLRIYEGQEIIETLYSELHALNVVVWNKLYKKEIFHELRFEDGKWHEDEFIVHRILAQAKRAVYSDAPLYYYLIRNTSFMGRQFNLTRLDYLEALEDRMTFLEENDLNKLYEKTLINYLNLLPTHYFLVHEFFPGERTILKGLVDKYRQLYQKADCLPTPLKIKYNLFSLSPFLYRLLRNVWTKKAIVHLGAER